MRRIKGFTALVLSSLIAFTAMGCNNKPNTEEGDTNTNNYSLTFVNENGKYLAVIKDNSEIISKTKYPVKIKIKTSASEEEFLFKEYQTGYDSVSDNLATATLTTDNGSVFFVQDEYLKNDTGYKVNRSVTIQNAKAGDYGYQSIYSTASQGGLFDYFVPGMLYKDTEFSRSGSLFSDMEMQRIYARETRTGLPMAMIRNRQSGYAISLAHLKAQVKSAGVGVGSESINDGIQFGSLGYSFEEETTVDFCYPGAEGYTKDSETLSWANPYHEVKNGGGHSYSLSILLDKNENYNQAMMQSYLNAYKQQEVEVFNGIDINEVHEENIKIFKDEFKVYNTTSNREVVGYDFEYYLPNATGGGQSLQMGFVGQQCYAGFQLLKYGYDNNDQDCITKGEKIIDFWVDICDTYTLPCVWWQPLENDIGGKPFVDGSLVYPVFIRCLVDGMDGILEAYKCSRENGKENKSWYDALIKIADHLCTVQNADGSFCRAYDYMTGRVSTNKTQAKYQCDSKLNTPIAINFMAKMYELTGDVFYKESALLAADYVYEEIYLKYGKFVGGTPDNPNVTDKEAAVFAMEGFLSAYLICDKQEDKQKYLEACEFSAVCAMSWVYTYDFVVPSQTEDLDAVNPFLNGGTTGFSLIALGHSAADTFISFAYAEYFKLYAITGNELYLNMAGILQNNTKQVTDFDGRIGYKYSAMSIEASNIHDFSFRTASGGVWLPWIGVANLNGISEMNKMFNEADVLVAKNLQNIKATVENYGCGGKLS